MTRSARRARARTGCAIGAAVAFLTGGCGARLTASQVASLNGSGPGGGGAAVAGATTAVSPGPSGGGSSVAGGGGGSSGPAAAVTAGRYVGGSSGSSIGGSGAGAGGSAGGRLGTTRPGSTAAANPLAGPGGQVCAADAPGSGPGVTPSTITIGSIETVNGPVPGVFVGARVRHRGGGPVHQLPRRHLRAPSGGRLGG